MASSGGSGSSSSSRSSINGTLGTKLENAKRLSIEHLEVITDNFSPERVIGRGGYGTVYKGVQADGKNVAVKVLHKSMTGIDNGEFKHEFESLMRLKHHNIIQLVGYCYETQHKPMLHDGETIFAEDIYKALCFEYMQNGSLKEHISVECDGLEWHTRYKIIKGTCEGLKYLHEEFKEPIYHLDLKPENILLDDTMVPKLADFGSSKLFCKELTMVIPQNLAATIGYVPPEYYSHQVVSKKFDIFSLGVVMAKIIAGPRGNSLSAEMDYQDFLDQVHENWRKRLEETWHNSELLQAYCQQVNICTTIALSCMDYDRFKRPAIMDIIDKLNETETVIEELDPDQQWTRYIAPEQVPVQFRGLFKEDDPDFTTSDSFTELTIKASSKKTIKIPVTKNSTIVWELRVVGWEVRYGAEFTPDAEWAYTFIVKKTRKVRAKEPIMKGSFKASEAGKMALMIINVASKKKKLLYRSKVKRTAESVRGHNS